MAALLLIMPKGQDRVVRLPVGEMRKNPLRKCLLTALCCLPMLAGCGRSTPTAPTPSPQILWPTVVLEALADDLRLTADPVQTAISPDGSRVVAVVPTFDGAKLVTWDARSGSMRSQWNLPKPYRASPKQYALQCSADARIVCCRTPGIVIWDTQRQQEIASLGRGAVAVSFNGELVAAATEDWLGDVVLFDALTGTERSRLNVLSDREIKSPDNHISAMWFSPDDKFLIVQDTQSRGCPEVWDLHTSTLIARLWGNPASRVIFSADGKRMATHGEQTIRIWDVVNWKELHCLNRSEYLPGDMAFSANGNSLWHHRDGNSIFLWDLASAAPVGAVQLASEEDVNRETGLQNQKERHVVAGRLAISPDGKGLVSKDTYGKSGYQFSAAVYDLDIQTAKNTSQVVMAGATVETPDHLMAELTYPRSSHSSAEVSIGRSEGVVIASDSKRVALFGRKDVLVMEASDPRNRRVINYPRDRFHLGRSPAWSESGELLSTLGESVGYARTIVQWDVETRESEVLEPDIRSIWEQQPWSDVQDVLTCLSYSPDDRVLAAGNRAGNVILIDSGSGEIMGTLEGRGRGSEIKQLVFVENGAALLGYGGEVLRWDLAKTEKPGKANVLFKPAGDGFVLSAHGVLGASVVNGGTEIVVQEASTGKVIDTWKPKLEEIEGIEVSADGTFLAAWPGLSRDTESGQVHIHNRLTKSGDVIIRHPKPRYWNRHSEITAVCFTDDNQRIITCDTLAVRIWRNKAAEQQ